jgi:hypothetical protein
VCDVARLIAYGSVPLAYLLGHLFVVQLFFVAFASGTAFVFFNSAQVATLPRVVPPALIPQATAWNASAESAATILGPAFGGLVISLARTIVGGSVLAYLLDSLSYLVSGLSLRATRVSFQEERSSEKRPTLWVGVGEGLHFLWSQRQIRALAGLLASIGLLSSFADLAVIVLAQRDLHAEAWLIGLIFSLGSAGGLLGSVIAGPLSTRVPFGRILTGTTLVEAVAVAILALATSPLMLMLGLAMISLAIPIFGVTQLSYRLSLIPDALQGRLNSIFDLLFFGSQPLGVAIGGLLLTAAGPRLVLGTSALGLALAALVVGLAAMKTAWGQGRLRSSLLGWCWDDAAVQSFVMVMRPSQSGAFGRIFSTIAVFTDCLLPVNIGVPKWLVYQLANTHAGQLIATLLRRDTSPSELQGYQAHSEICFLTERNRSGKLTGDTVESRGRAWKTKVAAARQRARGSGAGGCEIPM